MLCTATYNLTQNAEIDGMEVCTSRTLEFEISADVDSEGWVDGACATLVRITETAGGDVLDCRKFAATDDTAKRFGLWFDRLMEESDDLRFEIERLLVEDRESQIEDAQMRAAA
jgi:hypothetical protein